MDERQTRNRWQLGDFDKCNWMLGPHHRLYAELLFINTDFFKHYLCDDKPLQMLTTKEGSVWFNGLETRRP
jgi:hypothetical protein